MQTDAPDDGVFAGRTPMDQHRCQCKHCGREMWAPTVYFTPVPYPPPCEHNWQGVSVWKATNGEHGSRRCAKCGLYEQW